MVDKEDVDIWPENVDFVEFFARLGDSAWNVGMNGRTGLRYEAMPFIFEMRGIKRKKWPKYFEALEVMVPAALNAMHKTA